MIATEPMHLRHPHDAYMTPLSAITDLLDAHLLPGDGWICEPCAGDGAIVGELARRYPDRGLRAIEIQPEYAPDLNQWTTQVITADFRAWAAQYRRDFPEREIAPSVIITNPPFSRAREILDAAFLLAGPQTQIIMLLRLAFLESRARREWWQAHPVDHLYVLSERPSFTNDGRTLGQAFGWFVWGPGVEKGVTVL